MPISAWGDTNTRMRVKCFFFPKRLFIFAPPLDKRCINVTVNNRFGLHQRIMLMIMLVLLQFYSIGSDFFPENITTTSMEMVDKEAPDVLLDFDDNASLRTVRQEQVQIRALEIDLIWDLFTILDLHELIHSLELRQCAKLPLFYNLHKAQNFVWFCSYLI